MTEPPFNPNLDVQVHTQGEHSIVEIDGDIDVYTCAQLLEALQAVSAGGCHLLAIDMTDVSFMDSSGLGILAGAVKRAAAGGGSVVLVGVCDHIMNTLRITGMTKVLPVFSTLDEAIARIDGGGSSD